MRAGACFLSLTLALGAFIGSPSSSFAASHLSLEAHESATGERTLFVDPDTSRRDYTSNKRIKITLRNFGAAPASADVDIYFLARNLRSNALFIYGHSRKRIAFKPAASAEFSLESPSLHAVTFTDPYWAQYTRGAVIAGWLVIGKEGETVFETRGSTLGLVDLTKDSAMGGQVTLSQLLQNYEQHGGKIDVLPEG